MLENGDKEMKKWLGVGMLLLTAIIWGLAFVAQRVGMDYVEPFTFNFSRYVVGAVVLLPFVIFNQAKKKTTTKKNIKLTIIGGLVCGVLLCVATSLQQFGIADTEAAGKSGFLTALYIIIVPIIGMFVGQKSKPLIWVCVALATVGLYLICIKEGFSVAIGDIFLVGCALVFSIHIMVIDYVSPKIDGVLLSCMQFAVAGVISFVCALLFEKVSVINIFKAWIPVLYCGALSCGVAYTFQIIGQKYVEPTKASLIMCLEAAFATLGGWLILHEVMTLKELIGCIVVFAAIILAQFTAVKKKEND